MGVLVGLGGGEGGSLIGCLGREKVEVRERGGGSDMGVGRWGEELNEVDVEVVVRRGCDWDSGGGVRLNRF